MTANERLSAALGDRYRVERELGRGGMATVYLAEDLKHHRQVAVKVLRPELATALGPERFLREIEIAAKLTHPHILPLHDSGANAGFLYYVMPYVDGETLRDRLNRERQLPIEDALAITRNVAAALSHAHSHGVVHRDIKPENILLSAGEAVVADFGVARAIAAAGGERLTETGLAVGTPAYMSPEQAGGEREVDPRSDLYGLGCVVYEMLVGDPPFTASTPQAVLARKLVERPPPLRTVRETLAPAVEQTVLKALARLPADRFATVAQFVDALAQASVAPAAPEPAKRRPVRRLWSEALLNHRIVIAAVAGTLAVLAVPVAMNVGSLRDRLTGAATGPRIRSIAVLPLTNLSGDPDQEYLADGLTGNLITDLAKISALKVISRFSVMRYKEAKKPLRVIGEELNVDALLPGSVHRAGDRIRFHVELIDARTEQILWADSYDRTVADILVLQSEVARTVALEIRAQLTPQEQTRLTSARIVNPAAYEAVLKGQVHASAQTRVELNTAEQYFQRALREDPNYALAYAGIARVWNARRGMWYARSEEADQKAMEAIRKALALDSSLVEALGQLANFQAFVQWDWIEGESTYRRVLEIEPNRAGAHSGYATVLYPLGRQAEAVEHASRAIELDPLNPLLRAVYALILSFVGRDDEAIDQARRTLAARPGQNMAHEALTLAFRRKGMLKETVEALIGAANRDEDFEKARVLQRGYDQGRYRAAILSAAELLEARWANLQAGEAAVLPPSGFVTTAGEIAHLYHAAGLPEKTLEWWEKAVEHRDPSVNSIRATLPRGNIREENPRFQALLRRIGIP